MWSIVCFTQCMFRAGRQHRESRDTCERWPERKQTRRRGEPFNPRVRVRVRVSNLTAGLNMVHYVHSSIFLGLVDGVWDL